MSCNHVQPQCRFVQKQNLRFADQRHRDADPALPAAGELSSLSFQNRLQRKALRKLADFYLCFFFGKIVDAADQLQIFFHGKIRGHSGLLRRHADQPLNPIRFLADAVTANKSISNGRFCQT